MTEAEALEILKRDDDDMRKGYFCINDFLALEVAKTALEKQIAKKPFFNDFDYECPYCSTQPYEDDAENKKPLYCSICGQRLDWSEV